MSDDNLNDEETGKTVTPKDPISLEDQMDAILNDPQKKATLLLKMGLGDSGKTKQTINVKPMARAATLPLVGSLQVVGPSTRHSGRLIRTRWRPFQDILRLLVKAPPTRDIRTG